MSKAGFSGRAKIGDSDHTGQKVDRRNASAELGLCLAIAGSTGKWTSTRIDGRQVGAALVGLLAASAFFLATHSPLFHYAVRSARLRQPRQQLPRLLARLRSPARPLRL